MTERDDALREAIRDFPIVAWARRHLHVYPNDGGKVVYADCPFCKGKKKLGIYRYNRVATCGRCREGGHGGERWTGTASLPRLIKLVEGCSWREAFKLIYSMAGMPEPKWTPPDKAHVPQLPEGVISLSDCRDDEPAVDLLHRRGMQHLRSSSYLCIGGRYHERIIFPTYYNDTLTGFEAKAVHPATRPKSLYADDMETDSTVYTIRSWSSNSTICAVTESVIDAETFTPLEFNAVGCYGGFKDGQIIPLLELGVEKLVWFLDGDVLWSKLWKMLTKTLPFFENFVVPMPKVEDPNSLGSLGCRRLIQMMLPVWDHLEFMQVGLRWGHEL